LTVIDRTLRALVYGDVNLNLIDGSAVWLTSTVECLANAGVEVTVLLKSRIETDRLLLPLHELANVHVVEPAFATMSAAQAADAAVSHHVEKHFDLVVVRGSRVASAMVATGQFEGVLWTYLTDIPQSVSTLDHERLVELTAIVRGSRRVLCQTPELRTFVEAVVPGVHGRTLLWEPIIPDAPMPEADEVHSRDDHDLRLGYAGKFAPAWNTDLMLALPAQLSARGVPTLLDMVGDKIHREDRAFAQRMDSGLRGTPGVTWHGGLDRKSTLALMAACDVGLSWRDNCLDDSLELSTKALEYASVGTPPVLNRTPMHERVFGADYPLFTDPTTTVADLLARVHADRELLRRTSERARAVTEHYTMTAAVERTRRILARAFPSASAVGGQPLRVVIAGHDLKFMRGIADLLAARADLDVRIDEWSALAVHDEEHSRAMLAWADVVICEWVGPNAVWYSTRLLPHQRLIMRLHRFELNAPWIRDLQPSAVTRIVCVNEHYRQRTVSETAFASDTVVVIPNAIDRDWFDRPAAPGADRVLGMLGIVPFRKRPDRALSILRAVNEGLASARIPGPPFLLSLKSALPWELTWIWNRPQERIAYRALFDEIAQDPALRGRVVLDKHGGDVPAWLQRTGWVLSLSEDESFHLAPAEGMVAGAIPALLNWPGAADVYDARYVHANESAIAQHILDVTAEGSWERRSNEVRADFRDAYDLPTVAEQWARLVMEGR
jgi:glycosyltransferase involved in cell wall biosynthesis